MKMISLFISSCLCLNLLATPVSQRELDRINALLLLATGDSLTVTVTAAERDENSGEIISADTTSIIKTSNGMNFTVEVGFERQQNSLITFNGSARGKVSGEIIRNRDILIAVALASPVIDQINDQGKYNATLNHISSISESKIIFKLEPAAALDELLQSIIIKTTIPKNAGSLSLSLEGTVKTKQTLIELLSNLDSVNLYQYQL